MKPIGCYGALGGPDPPAWVSWGKVPEWTADRLGMFRAAAALSARRPFSWVLHIGTVGIEANFASIMRDVCESGLFPHIRGVEFLDEPLSNVDAKQYDAYHWRGKGEPTRWQRLESGFAWLCDEYAALDDLYPKRWQRVWSDHLFNTLRHFGPDYWRPCPPQVQLLQLTSYNLDLLPIFVRHAINEQPRDLVLTPRWFAGPSPDVYGPMTQAIVDAYPPLLEQSRVVGACGYAWHIEAPGFAGLAEMPAWQSAVARSLGAE